LVLVVVWTSHGVIEIVEELHANHAIDVEEEHKQGHEPEDDGQNFKQDRIEILQLKPDLKFEVLQIVAVRNNSEQTCQSKNSPHFDYHFDSANGKKEIDETNQNKNRINLIPSIHIEILWPDRDDPQHELY
jgi:hypothetical protein